MFRLCLYQLYIYQRRIQKEAWGAPPPPSPPLPPPFISNHLFFFVNFEELETVLIEVKLIINNAPLTYVQPNTIKTYLTPNHLLFGRQLLCYSNTISTLVRVNKIDKIDRISDHFWHRWNHGNMQRIYLRHSKHQN